MEKWVHAFGVAYFIATSLIFLIYALLLYGVLGLAKRKPEKITFNWGIKEIFAMTLYILSIMITFHLGV